MRLRDLFIFLVLTFLIAWAVLAGYVFMPDTMSRWFGALTGSHPLFYLAVWAPALSALAIVGWRTGLSGVRRFLGRLLLFRMSWPWFVFLLIGVPAVFFVAALLKPGAYHDPFPFPSLPAYLLTLFLMAIKGPVEEIGWRGLALPLLQQRMAPIWAAVVLGIIWGVWHLPAFLISGVPQSGWSFGHFFIGVVALSVIVTPLFNHSGTLTARCAPSRGKNTGQPNEERLSTKMGRRPADNAAGGHEPRPRSGEAEAAQAQPRSEVRSKRSRDASKARGGSAPTEGSVNRSRGSILLAAFFHLQLMNPLWPDAQPYDSYFFVGVALIVTWLNRRTMFSRESAVVEVVPQ